MSPPAKEEKDAAHSKGHAPEHIEGEENEWKFRAPYKIHEDNDDFDVKLEGHCHCGRVHYQLKRDKPLDAKYCHCTTCQRLHGSSSLLNPFQKLRGADTDSELRCLFPMGRNFPQRGHQLYPRPP